MWPVWQWHHCWMDVYILESTWTSRININLNLFYVRIITRLFTSPDVTHSHNLMMQIFYDFQHLYFCYSPAAASHTQTKGMNDLLAFREKLVFHWPDKARAARYRSRQFILFRDSSIHSTNRNQNAEKIKMRASFPSPYPEIDQFEYE